MADDMSRLRSEHRSAIDNLAEGVQILRGVLNSDLKEPPADEGGYRRKMDEIKSRLRRAFNYLDRI